jgi:hypothetical protein
VAITNTGAEMRIIPHGLTQLPLLRGFGDEAALSALADRFTQREYQPGDVIVRASTACSVMSCRCGTTSSRTRRRSARR